MKRKGRSSGVRRGKIRWDRLALGKVPDNQIADELGIHRSSVQEARVKRGIATYVDPDRAKRRNLARRMRLAGSSLSEIAAALGVSRQRAHQLVEDLPVRTTGVGVRHSYLRRKRGAKKRAGSRRTSGARK